MKKEKLQTVQESIQTQDRTYDKSAKNIIATRQFLSIILHERVPEFRPFPLELIERDCIEGTPWIEEIPIDPGLTNEKILPQKIRGQKAEVCL